MLNARLLPRFADTCPVERALAIIAGRTDRKDFPAETGIVECSIEGVIEDGGRRKIMPG
jgi:hypothetical protein